MLATEDLQKVSGVPFDDVSPPKKQTASTSKSTSAAQPRAKGHSKKGRKHKAATILSESESEDNIEDVPDSQAEAPDDDEALPHDCRILDSKVTSSGTTLYKMADGTWVTPYEHGRLIQIARNRELMERLGLTAAVEDLYGRPQVRENKKDDTPEGEFTGPSIRSLPPRVSLPRTSKNQTS